MPKETSTLDFRALLQAERDSLQNQISELGFDTSQVNGLSYDSNFADSSQVTAERGEAAMLAGELKIALREVDKALERIADGTFGICERCGKEISPDRLEAMPATTTCISCASASRSTIPSVPPPRGT